MMVYFRKSVFMLLLGMLTTGQALATVISLDFNSLPSSQGWVYEASGNSEPETDIYSPTGTSLIIDSMDIGFQPTGSHNIYSLFNVIDESLPFTLYIRAKVTEEARLPGTSNAYGFAFGVYTSTASYAFGLGVTELGIRRNVGIPIGDNTVYRDYLFSGNPQTGEYDITVDGVSVLSGITINANFDGTNRIVFGDGSGLVNAHTEVTAFVFRQDPLPVPTPPLVPLLLSGLLTMAFLSRKLTLKPKNIQLKGL